MKSQEMLAQEKLREILDLDYLEYTRGYAIQNWEYMMSENVCGILHIEKLSQGRS